MNINPEHEAPPAWDGAAMNVSLAVSPKHPSTAAFAGDFTSSYLNYMESTNQSARPYWRKLGVSMTELRLAYY